MLCDELSALTTFEVPPRPRFWRLFFISGRYKTAEETEVRNDLGNCSRAQESRSHRYPEDPAMYMYFG